MAYIRCGRCVAALVAACAAVFALPARAELEVSLVITGNMDEIRAVFDQLQASGIGEAGNAGEGLKLEVHSAAGTPMTEAPAEAEAAPAPEAPLTLTHMSVEPPTVLAGAVLRVSVKVQDKENRVDTIGANLHSAGKEFTFDLFDNGSHGDDTAGDGTWTVNVAVPGAATPGEYILTLYAYDATGERIALPNAAGELEAVSIASPLTVTP
jgi:hypothetical protein